MEWFLFFLFIDAFALKSSDMDETSSSIRLAEQNLKAVNYFDFLRVIILNYFQEYPLKMTD